MPLDMVDKSGLTPRQQYQGLQKKGIKTPLDGEQPQFPTQFKELYAIYRDMSSKPQEGYHIPYSEMFAYLQIVNGELTPRQFDIINMIDKYTANTRIITRDKINGSNTS